MLVVVVALAVSANSLPNEFVYDDIGIIRDNPVLQGPGDLGTIFGSSYWGRPDAEDAAYRPLTTLSFALERTVFGAGPYSVHVTNVILNAAVALAVLGLFTLLLGCGPVPLFAALLFAVHPIHAEVVANGVGRAELLAALLSLLAMLAHLRLVRGLRPARDPSLDVPAPRAPVAAIGLVIAGALYFAALLSKESAAVVPGLLFLGEWLIVERGRLRRMVPRLIPLMIYAVPLGAYLMVRAEVIGLRPSIPPEILVDVPALERRLLAGVTLLLQMGQILVPHGFLPDYRDYREPVSATVSDPLVLASLLAWVALAALLVWLWRRGQLNAVFAAGWFFLAALPTANLLFTIGTIRGDRLMYFPSVGFCLGLAVGLTALGRIRSGLPAIALALLLAWSAVVTVRQNAIWRNPMSLWTAAVEGNPGAAHPHRNLADALVEEGEDLERAAELYERAVTLREGVGFFYADARVQWAVLLRRQGRQAAAEEQCRRVVEERPDHFVATMNLGQILMEASSTYAESVALFERAVSMQPNNFHTHANLANALMRDGQFDEALVSADRAIALNDRQSYVWTIKASILRRLNRLEEADEAQERARSL